MKKSKIYFEEVRERFCGHIISSTVREATNKEIKTAKTNFEKTGKCLHNLIIDEPAWLYDYRSCAICGAGLGAI